MSLSCGDAKSRTPQQYASKMARIGLWTIEKQSKNQSGLLTGLFSAGGVDPGLLEGRVGES